MKCGYVNLTEGVTETVITEAGKKKPNPVQQIADQLESKKQPTARKSTTTSPDKKPNAPTVQQSGPTELQSDMNVPQPNSLQNEERPASIQDSDEVPKLPAQQISEEESLLRKEKLMEDITIKKVALPSSQNMETDSPPIELS